jgi:hypothetical protein
MIEINDFMFNWGSKFRFNRRGWVRIPGHYGTFTIDQATGNYKIPKMNFIPYADQIFLEICELLVPDEQDSQEYEPGDSP